MKRRILLTALTLALALLLWACGCKHEVWNDADCIHPRTCAECGETEGAPLGHSWMAATCLTPKTCENCALTEGEARGHSWTDATCTSPRLCESCKLTEGEALGHSWQTATTEQPKTCTKCGETEGEPIITDPRFTTEATAALQGTWICDHPMDSEYADALGITVNYRISIVLGNDGSCKFRIGIADDEATRAALTKYLADTIYAELAARGMTKEEADAAIIEAYGMDVNACAALSLAESDLMEVHEMDYVYYVEGDQFFLGESWTGAISPTTFALTADTLTLDVDFLDSGTEKTVFTRVTE